MTSNLEGSKPEAKPIQLMELKEDSTQEALLHPSMELIQGVKVRLSAFLGQCELTVEKLFSLREGAIVTLDRAAYDPIELYLDDKLVARGELVVVEENFGVRITELGGQRK